MSAPPVSFDRLRIRDLERENFQLRVCLQEAGIVHRSHFPRCHPEVPGYEFFTHYQPVMELGSDLYDLLILPDGKIAVLVANLGVPGIPNSICASYILGLTRAILPSMTDPGKSLSRLNWKLLQSGTDYAAGMLLVLIDPKDGSFSFSNAANESPMIYRDGQLHVLSDGLGSPIGVQGGSYPTANGTLKAGECLVLMTDGLTEALDADDRSLGVRGIRGMAKPGLGAVTLGERIVLRVGEYQAGPQRDDQTLVVVGRE